MKVLTDTPFMAFVPESPDIIRCDSIGLALASKDGHAVLSYVELLSKVAALSYYNSRFQLLFRGQSKDFYIRTNTQGMPEKLSCLLPPILRPVIGNYGDIPFLESQFETLALAEGLLMEELGDADIQKLQIVRWSILQHYNVCATPLLDVTLALQIALTFATANSTNGEGYLYVLAVPQLSGPVSVSTESMTQTVDLSQVCPAEALRPHFQSGVLIGDYPEYSNRHETHNKLGFVANSFACRLLSKFHLKDTDNWSSQGFTPTPDSILFPNTIDPWYRATRIVKDKLYHYEPGLDYDRLTDIEIDQRLKTLGDG